MDSPLSGTIHGYADQRDATNGFPLDLIATGTDGKTQDTHFLADLRSGETRTFTFACAVAKTPSEAEAHLNQTLAAPDPLKVQTAARWARDALGLRLREPLVGEVVDNTDTSAHLLNSTAVKQHRCLRTKLAWGLACARFN